MFVLVTFQPDTPANHNEVIKTISHGGRSYYRIPGSAYIVKPTGKDDARKIQKKLKAFRGTDPTFDFCWFRINPHMMKYHPDESDQCPGWANFDKYKDILKEEI